MIKLLDVVKLIVADNEHGVPKGATGTVVDVLENGKAYTVEFVDGNGDTIEDSLFTEYAGDVLEVVTPYVEIVESPSVATA